MRLMGREIRKEWEVPRIARTIHPTKSFSRYHFEVDALVAVFRIDQMRKLHRIKLERRTVIAVSLTSVLNSIPSLVQLH